MLRRKITDQLLAWKNTPGRKPLIIKGCRQCGKTFSVLEFARKNYKHTVYLNFFENPDYASVFSGSLEIDNIVMMLSALLGKDAVFEPGQTILILDEIQDCPEARTALKFFRIDGRYDVIGTGSLLGVKGYGKEPRSVPVGSETVLEMYPLDFEEFLWANNDDFTFSIIKEAFDYRKPLGDAIHNKIMTKFREYLVVGGMPQAVESFVNGETYEQIDFVKRNILSLYQEDLAKYDDENHEKASVVFKTIPEQLENKNSHFKMSKVDKNARYQNYIDAISFISESMIGNECINVTQPEISLELYADRSNFKLYMMDTGLLISMIMASSSTTEDNIYKSLIFNKLSINQGMIIENMVAQMLRSSGHELYFHEYMYASKDKKEHKYEIDFITLRKRFVL